jgi:hypothetical protein
MRGARVSLRNFLWTNRLTKRKVKSMKIDGPQNKPSMQLLASIRMSDTIYKNGLFGVYSLMRFESSD